MVLLGDLETQQRTTTICNPNAVLFKHDRPEVQQIMSLAHPTTTEDIKLDCINFSTSSCTVWHKLDFAQRNTYCQLRLLLSHGTAVANKTEAPVLQQL